MTRSIGMTCGCNFEVIEQELKAPLEKYLELGVKPPVKLDVRNVRKDCPAVWHMLAEGRTKGVFQLESPLGRQWCKKLRPESIEHLAALGALLRPGCLRAENAEGVSMTELYCKRKNHELPVEMFHECLREILGPTYGVLTYQEQAMQIAQVVAGFNLQEADMLRKAIGKKLPEEMAKCKILFRDGAAKVGKVTVEEAETIFGWIEKSQRYSFNKCLHKDTIICRMFKGRFPFTLTVEEMYKIRNNIEYAKASGYLSLYKKWKLRGNYGKGLSLCSDGRIRPNIIKDIRWNGYKTVYKITTESGKTITVTDTHKFPTPNGEKTTKELTSGDTCLFVANSYEITDFKKYKYSNFTKDDFKQRKSSHDGITKVGQKGYRVIQEKILSIEYAGEADTYDVEMEAPYHNLVVNDGIVTCNSHAVSYAINGYYTAYCKAHFPLNFFTEYLRFAKEKQKPRIEIKELVQEAKLFGIEVYTPDIRRMNDHFEHDGKTIYFGLSDVKGIGEAQIKKLFQAIEFAKLTYNKELHELSWYEFLVLLSDNVSKTVVNNLVSVGAMRCFDE